MTDEIEKLEALAARFNEHLPLSDLATWNNEWGFATQPAAILALIDRLKKAEAERDETQQFLDELQGEFDKQNTAFWATSEKLRIAEAELAASRQQKPLAVFDGYEDGDTSRPRFRIIDGELIVGELLYASPIAAPVPATQPKAEISDEQIAEIAENYKFKEHYRSNAEAIQFARAILAEASKGE